MDTTSRFEFPGFTLLRQGDTESHEVEIGTIKMGDETFVVHLIRRKGLTFEGSFLLAKIFDAKEEKSLWSFPKDYIDSIGVLALADEEPVAALVQKGKDGRVKEIFPFSSLTATAPLDLRRRLELKRKTAAFLHRKYECTETERKLNSVLRRRQEEEYAAKQAAAHEERAKARAELQARIYARGNIEVYTSQGYKRYGFPVIGDEWMSLPGGTLVVLVESFDDEGKTCGKPIEAFKVKREKGKNPSKEIPAPVTLERPAIRGTATVEAMPKPVDLILVEAGAKAYEVAVYATMEEIRKARRLGLNGGGYVTAKTKLADGKYEIYSVTAEDLKTVGLFTPLE